MEANFGVSLALNPKKIIVPVTRGNGKYYLQTTRVINGDGLGILQQLKPMEKEVMTEAKMSLSKWRKAGITQEEIALYYHFLDTKITAFYQTIR